MDDELHISVLGPVSVRTGGETTAVRSRPQRIVLACLALEANRVVSTAVLTEALWRDDPPANAAGNLHSYVSKLRVLVGSDRIRREHGGYRLTLEQEAVDALRVEQLANTAEALAPPERAAVLEEALSLWEGQPLSELDDVDALVPQRTRLEALHRELTMRRLAAVVATDQPGLGLPDLRQEAVRHPHDERVVTLLARALHRTGRRAEALRVIANFRRQIIEDTGLSAGPELTALERIVLDDSELRAEGSSRSPRATEAPTAPATSEWPRPTTPLYGRADLLAELDALLGVDRVVTLTGVGGIGKTRLACALADARSDAGQAVHFLPLAALTPDDDLTARLAAALRVRVGAGREPWRAVHERIGSGGQLLVLDNCEHVLDAVGALVQTLLTQRSDLTVLTTSRAPLGLAAERVVRVPPLDEAGSAARDLFLERVRRVRPDFEVNDADEEAIRRLLRGLAGLPLAIELAAGRMSSMALVDLTTRIGDLDLLSGGRPTERHRTLRAAIDWSYRLLDEPARRLLRAMSLFPGGVDLSIVEELAADLRLAGGGAAEAVALADASLIDANVERSTRYTMLEPVRAFAEERLERTGERAAVESARARWARRTTAWIEEACRSPQEAAADARLRTDLVNLRSAHRAALQQRDLDTAIAISVALMRPATARDLPEIWSWTLDLAAHPALRGHHRCADALGAAANAAWLIGDLETSEQLAIEGHHRDATSVPCLQALGSVRLFLGEPEAARQLWVAASRPLGAYLPQAALAAVYTGDVGLARRSLADADAWAVEVGSPSEVALCRYAWGELLGPDPAARDAYEEAITLASGVGASFVASISRVGLASTLTSTGQLRRAADEFDAVIRYWRTTGNRTQQWTTLRNAADLMDALGRSATAERIRAAAARASGAAAFLPVGDLDTTTVTALPPISTESIVALVLAELAEVRPDPPTGRAR